MITDGKSFDTNTFFAGGAGMFIQYHDIIKPVYLYAIVSLVTSDHNYGVPIDIIQRMSILSLVEWYKNRRYKNPIMQLDFQSTISEEEADQIMEDILQDSSIYTLAPTLNIEHMLNVYRQQHLNFPIIVYSEKEEPHIAKDCKQIFENINFTYLHGSLENAIRQCSENFTYMFSDINLLQEAAKILIGTCSHLLLAKDYRYNYKDYFENFKYDLNDIMVNHPFVRIGTTEVFDIEMMSEDAFENISEEDEEEEFEDGALLDDEEDYDEYKYRDDEEE